MKNLPNVRKFVNVFGTAKQPSECIGSKWNEIAATKEENKKENIPITRVANFQSVRCTQARTNINKIHLWVC